MDAKSTQPLTFALELPERAGTSTEAVPLPPRPTPAPKRSACVPVWRAGPVGTGPAPGAGFWKRRFLLLSLALVLAFLACYLAGLAMTGPEYGAPVAPGYPDLCSDGMSESDSGSRVCESPPGMGGALSLEKGEQAEEGGGAVEVGQAATATVPQYFQTSPELWYVLTPFSLLLLVSLTGLGRAGPTATGKAPFMAQTRTFEGTYVPNAPLQTAVPVVGGGDEGRKSIFEMMG